MRKPLLFVLLLQVSIIGSTQNDTIFPNVTASWSVKMFTYDWEPYYADYSCQILNDTIDTLGMQWSTMLDESMDTVGWVAIDSGKVYYKGINVMGLGLADYYDGDTILVMYDFNLQIGDTAYYDTGVPMIVEDIMINNFLGVPKRTFYLGGSGYADTWVEGLGSTAGFFRPVMSTFELGISLCWFSGEYMDSLNQIYYLSFDDAAACELSTFENHNNLNFEYGYDWISISLENPSELIIYNLTGSVVSRQYLASGVNRINVDYLATGLYIIKVGDFFSDKFVRR